MDSRRYNLAMSFRPLLVLSLALLAVPLQSQPAQPPSMLTALPTPAAPGSGEPQLSVSSRGTLLSWIELQDKVATLKFAERTPSGWTQPRAIVSGSDWFINWADVPSVMRLANGTIVAHWLQKSGAATYAYDVRVSHSTDDGRTWTASVTPHSTARRPNMDSRHSCRCQALVLGSCGSTAGRPSQAADMTGMALAP